MSTTDGPFRSKRRIDLAKIRAKRYGRDTLIVGNPDKLRTEAARHNLRVDPSEKHAGYLRTLSQRITECSNFLDGDTLALATNFIPKTYFSEISNLIKTRDFDAVSTLKIAENFSKNFPETGEQEFFERTAKKFHALLGDLTPLESLKLAQILADRNSQDRILLGRISKKLAAHKESVSWRHFAELSEVFQKLNFRDVSLLAELSEKSADQNDKEDIERIKAAWTALDVDLSRFSF